MAKAKTLVGLDVHRDEDRRGGPGRRDRTVADVRDERREHDRSGVLRWAAQAGPRGL